jgi:hypothetical protein
MQRDARSPDAYRNAAEGPQRELLDTIRGLVMEVAPGVVESIGHGMLDYPGLANLAAQKQYVSLYVAPSALDLHRDELAGINCGRSCVRFRRLEQVDPDVVPALLRDVLRGPSASD